jgi:S1-C subfamily serine protease
MLGNRHVGTALRDVEPGEPLELTLQRNQTHTVVHLTRDQPGFLGIAYAELTVEDRQQLGLADGEGVRVQQVLADGPAAAAGLRVGDIILQLANEPARHESIAGRLQAVGAHNTVEMQILRDGETLQRRAQLSETQPSG